jgi:hypothetical protein
MGQSIRKLGFKESVSWLWQFSKRRYIENTGRCMEGRAVKAPTDGHGSLEKKILFALGSSYYVANLQ